MSELSTLIKVLLGKYKWMNESDTLSILCDFKEDIIDKVNCA
jgi:hypothetical protein